MNESSNGNTEQTKRCYGCGEVKDVSLFNKDRSRRDGLQPLCKSCRKTQREINKQAKVAYDKTYYQANKEAKKRKTKIYDSVNRERVRKRKRVYYKNNIDAIRAYKKTYRQANKKRITAQKKAHYQNNKDYYNERSAARRANKKKNTPKFIRNCPVEKQRMVFAYKLSRLLTETTGVLHHVDHMWPISDGGPHWSGNLQVIPAVDNLSKHATVDEEIKKTIKEGLEYARRESKGR